MSRIEILKNARTNTSVKFMEFTRIASKKNGKYAVFFEGDDEKYYSVRINTIRPDIRWCGIDSGGKHNVINLHEKIRTHPTYNNSLCMFFVDADFDSNTKIKKVQDIYITPRYSVENLYISDNAFKRILSAEFGINDSHESEQCYLNAIEIFKKTKSSYLESIKPFNTLIRELRNMENIGGLNTRLNINNINFNSLVKIKLGSVDKLYDETFPNSLFSELDNNIKVDLEASEKHFTNWDGELWFRGKQNLEFFRIFLYILKEDRCKKKNRTIFKNKGNLKLNLTKGNCISELSQYADTPSCLTNFLESAR